MFGWWKKSEGFEWREYVRTTILVRRQKRRERVEDVKAAAVAGLKDAGKAGAKASASGLSRLGRATAAGAERIGRLVELGLAALGRAPGRLSRLVLKILKPVARFMATSNTRGPILLIGAIGIAAALFRGFTLGLDVETLIAGCLGLAGLALGLLPMSLSTTATQPAWIKSIRSRLPRMPAASPVFGGGLILAGIAAIAGYGAAQVLAPRGTAALRSGLPSFSSLPSLSASTSKSIEGRATVVSGDLLKVGNVMVQLADVEAPEADQRCSASGKKAQRCGEMAMEVLTRIVRGKLVSCTLSSSNAGSRSLAVCRTDGADIAATLVRQGHLFAQQGMFARYASAEVEARNAKAGMWRGEAQRPAEWRAKRWDEAKRASPDGCPIKGAVSNDGKVYVLPWSREYDRVKVRTGKGERWFCSEQEARSAGWRLAERS